MWKHTTDHTWLMYLNQQLMFFTGTPEADMGNHCTVLKQAFDQTFSADLHLL